METQLVRLDKPYNIIIGRSGHFALHIATLIVVKEKIEGVPNGMSMGATLNVCSYPVVSNDYQADGQVWTDTELKDCHVVCSQQCKEVSIYALRNVMEYCAKHGVYLYTKRIPSAFVWTMSVNDVDIVMLTDEEDKPFSNYDVSLVFEEANDGNTCMAVTDGLTPFYFYEYFSNDPTLVPNLPTNQESLKKMAALRDDYLRLFRHDGLRSITFSTEDKKYQWFVDRLNAKKVDE